MYRLPLYCVRGISKKKEKKEKKDNVLGMISCDMVEGIQMIITILIYIA